MSSEELIVDKKKHIISMRLEKTDRYSVQSIASRLYVRESEIYRFAINFLLNRIHKLNDFDCTGSDLLPLFLELKEEINQSLGLKKQQLFKIINSGNADPNKFVAMMDIELLLLPEHLVRQILLQKEDAIIFKDPDIKVWLENYFYDKYGFFDSLEENEENIEADNQCELLLPTST